MIHCHYAQPVPLAGYGQNDVSRNGIWLRAGGRIEARRSTPTRRAGGGDVSTVGFEMQLSGVRGLRFAFVGPRVCAEYQQCPVLRTECLQERSITICL